MKLMTAMPIEIRQDLVADGAFGFHVKMATHQNGDTHITRTATPRIPKRRHSINPKLRQSRLNEGTTIAYC